MIRIQVKLMEVPPISLRGVLDDKISSSPLLQQDSQQARDLHISC